MRPMFDPKRLEAKAKLCLPVQKQLMRKWLSDPDDQDGIVTLNHLKHGIFVKLPEGGQKLVNVCSDIYQLIPVGEIMDKFEDVLGRHFDFEAKYRQTENCRFFIDYVIKTKEVLVKPNGSTLPDTMYPKIRIATSYDSSNRYGVMTGFYRQVCSNGMMAQRFNTMLRKKHYPNLLEEIEKTSDIVMNFVEQAQEYVAEFTKMAEKEFPDRQTFAHYLEQVLREVGMVKQIDAVMAQVEKEQVILGTSEWNGWMLYNGINFQLNHNTTDLWMPENRRMAVDERVSSLILA